jgi:hypothetical protein
MEDHMSFTKDNVKILYLADDYAKDVAGVKISLYNELRKRGFSVDMGNVHSWAHNYIDGNKLLPQLKKSGYTHLFIAHTWAKLAHRKLEDINNLGVKVLGFGFSDPYGWDAKRLDQYNYYATHSWRLANETLSKPTLYFTTSCDLAFHKKLGTKKTTDILFIGCGSHPWFRNTDYRLEMVNQLRNDFAGITVHGNDWGKVPAGKPIHGHDFLTAINKAKIGIDLEEPHAPLAHRTFEFPACGVPIITRDRPDVRGILSPSENILVYNSYADLTALLRNLLADDVLRATWASKMYENTVMNHTIIQRVDHLLNWLDRL